MNPGLLENNHILLRDFLDKGLVNDLYHYFLSGDGKETGKYIDEPDLMGPTYNWYCPAAAQELLCYLTKDVVDICGAPLFPTYSYVRNYLKDGHLLKHTDKPPCEVSMTIHLGSDVEWEFGILDPEGKEHITLLKPGDAIMYCGCIAPHWRVGTYKGEHFIQTFLHWVRSRGPLSTRIFDMKNEEPVKGWKTSLISEYKELLAKQR